MQKFDKGQIVKGDKKEVWKFGEDADKLCQVLQNHWTRKVQVTGTISSVTLEIPEQLTVLKTESSIEN